MILLCIVFCLLAGDYKMNMNTTKKTTKIRESAKEKEESINCFFMVDSNNLKMIIGYSQNQY